MKPDSIRSLVRVRDGRTIAARVRLADSFWRRFRGLMLSPPLSAGDGLLLLGSGSIHMLFMRFPIDAVFLDRSHTVRRVARALRPWTGTAVCPGAVACLELPAGAAADLREGDRLRIEHHP